MHDTVFHDSPSKTVGFYFPQPGAMLDRSEDLLNKLSALRASCFLHEAQENRVDDREEVKEKGVRHLNAHYCGGPVNIDGFVLHIDKDGLFPSLTPEGYRPALLLDYTFTFKYIYI